MINPQRPLRRVADRQVLADRVYDQLFEALMDGELEADTPISIDGVSRELDVSQTPVREALARLEATGLVRRFAHRGYRVAPIYSAEEIVKLMEARIVLEPVNALLASSHTSPEFLAELRDSITSLASSPRGPSFSAYREYWQADERFHRVIAETANNPFLLAAYSALGGQAQRFRLFSGHQVNDASQAVAEHTSILNALENGDAQGARSAMVAHLSAVQVRAIADRQRQVRT
jgi:DNA-binding GntR family transcriptional regulator